MIVVKVELWPHGDRAKSRELCRAVICNDGSGDLMKGNYCCAISHAAAFAKKPGAWKMAKVIGFPRTRYSPFEMVKRALAACLISRDRVNEYANEIIERTREADAEAKP